ncbi:MAG: hypothetical protein KDB87_19550, partial [Flavobacteriales bacterium]|nr:hypothetical protein [Flavobacteriales bacterium]
MNRSISTFPSTGKTTGNEGSTLAMGAADPTTFLAAFLASARMSASTTLVAGSSSCRSTDNHSVNRRR